MQLQSEEMSKIHELRIVISYLFEINAFNTHCYMISGNALIRLVIVRFSKYNSYYNESTTMNQKAFFVYISYYW